jgi:hypothetical protein
MKDKRKREVAQSLLSHFRKIKEAIITRGTYSDLEETYSVLAAHAKDMKDLETFPYGSASRFAYERLMEMTGQMYRTSVSGKKESPVLSRVEMVIEDLESFLSS